MLLDPVAAPQLPGASPYCRTIKKVSYVGQIIIAACPEPRQSMRSACRAGLIGGTGERLVRHLEQRPQHAPVMCRRGLLGRGWVAGKHGAGDGGEVVGVGVASVGTAIRLRLQSQ